MVWRIAVMAAAWGERRRRLGPAPALNERGQARPAQEGGRMSTSIAAMLTAYLTAQQQGYERAQASLGESITSAASSAAESSLATLSSRSRAHLPARTTN